MTHTSYFLLIVNIVMTPLIDLIILNIVSIFVDFDQILYMH